VGDLLRQGAQWLEQQRAAHCSSPVPYRRDQVSYEIDATFGRTQYEVEDGHGLRIGAEVIDFLVSAEAFSLMFDEPEAGDQIVADGVVYEVMDLAGGAFSQSFTSERRVLPEYELADLKDLRVTVVPAAAQLPMIFLKGRHW